MGLERIMQAVSLLLALILVATVFMLILNGMVILGELSQIFLSAVGLM